MSKSKGPERSVAAWLETCAGLMLVKFQTPWRPVSRLPLAATLRLYGDFDKPTNSTNRRERMDRKAPPAEQGNGHRGGFGKGCRFCLKRRKRLRFGLAQCRSGDVAHAPTLRMPLTLAPRQQNRVGSLGNFVVIACGQPSLRPPYRPDDRRTAVAHALWDHATFGLGTNTGGQDLPLADVSL